MKLIEVYRTFSAADAHLICSALQSAGLGASVTNELATLSLDGYAVASGGIRVVVPEEQFDEARAIIEEGQDKTSEDSRKND